MDEERCTAFTYMRVASSAVVCESNVCVNCHHIFSSRCWCGYSRMSYRTDSSHTYNEVSGGVWHRLTSFVPENTELFDDLNSKVWNFVPLSLPWVLRIRAGLDFSSVFCFFHPALSSEIWIVMRREAFRALDLDIRSCDGREICQGIRLDHDQLTLHFQLVENTVKCDFVLPSSNLCQKKNISRVFFIFFCIYLFIWNNI